jgi:hypothetical protein
MMATLAGDMATFSRRMPSRAPKPIPVSQRTRNWLAIGVCVAAALAQPAFGKDKISCGGPDFTHERSGPPPVQLVAGSLPSGVPRPGPDVLYWPLAEAPQLENTGPWQAPPILISGASAYRHGEFLYQDFLYDDTGARGTSATGAGTYTYPTDPAYARNAADLVEVRFKLLAKGTAVRLTYNTMLNPELVATTIVLGDSAGLRPLPHGANVQAPAEVFVTVHGFTGDIIDAATGAPITDADLTVDVDMNRRQVHLCIPFAAFDPSGKTVRVAAGTGLWDAANNRYLIPVATATATLPGGAGTLVNPPAFFNAAFRYDEPLTGNDNTRQGTVLHTGDLGPFFAEIDFAALQRHVDDDMAEQFGGVPQTGYMNRIFASHFEQAQGRGSATTLQPDLCPAGGCQAPSYAGRLEPYEIYVPMLPPPVSGYGFFINPHAAGGNQNNYTSFASRWQVEVGERDIPFISVTPNARGTAYWYYGQSGAEVFEVWADVAHRYKLDPTITQIGGLSMGGFATWKLGGQFPDLFAAAPMIVPCPSAGVVWVQGSSTVPGGVASENILLAPSFRNVPQYIWTGSIDPICAHWAQVDYANRMDSLGYRYQFFSFLGQGHAFVLGNEFQPMVDWMGVQKVVRDPPHITYALNGMANEPDVGLNADHAYWLSGLELRDTSVTPPIGTIDVFSHGFGVGDPPAAPTQFASGEYQGTTGLKPWESQSKSWGAAPAIPVANRVDIVATNIRAVTIHPERARVDCNAVVNVQSDGPITVTLAGCR